MEGTKQDVWAEQRDKMLEECFESITQNYKLALRLAENAGYERGTKDTERIYKGRRDGV